MMFSTNSGYVIMLDMLVQEPTKGLHLVFVIYLSAELRKYCVRTVYCDINLLGNEGHQ